MGRQVGGDLFFWMLVTLLHLMRKWHNKRGPGPIAQARARPHAAERNKNDALTFVRLLFFFQHDTKGSVSAYVV